MSTDALQQFTTEVTRADHALRLDRAALWIAVSEYPDLQVSHYTAELDRLAAAVRSTVPPLASKRTRAQALRAHLFEHLSFKGNEASYYDPRNSYLNEVIERRTGIPITLATVFLEVAWRLELPASGVGYPRHFLVKYEDDTQEWVLDPFYGGQAAPLAEMRAQLSQKDGVPERLVDYHLAAVTRRQMLARMLNNLKAVYAGQDDIGRLLRVQEFVIALQPWSLPDVRDRGVLRAQNGDIAGAVADLEAYLDHSPDADDSADVRRYLARVRSGFA